MLSDLNGPIEVKIFVLDVSTEMPKGQVMGAGRGIFELQEFFFVIKFLV